MNDAPRTKGRHALFWVLGVGLVFVLVVGLALQEARRRADERWVSVAMAWDPKILIYIEGFTGPPVTPPVGRPELSSYSYSTTRGGNIFQEWQQGKWVAPKFSLVLRQERSFFGMNISARLSRGRLVMDVPTETVRVIHDILAAEDVELVVEP